MTEIHLDRSAEGAVHTFSVRLSDAGSDTRHEVTLSEQDYLRLGREYATPEEFVHACFSFLLAREPKEQILPKFDVSAISRYFPEFEDRIRR